MTDKVWRLVLFVTEEGTNSNFAKENVRKLGHEFLNDRYELEVIDLAKDPEMAFKHNILAVPTLVKELPLPAKRVIGNLSNINKLAEELGVPVS